MNTITEGKYIDLFATYRFLRILTIPWEDQEAFKLGIIDGEGKRIKEKKLTTSNEKDAYTMLHRMVFNFKRILSKIPLVKSKLGTYAAALFLLKEHMKEDEYNLLVEYISKTGKFDDELTKNINKLTLTEALCLLEEENMAKDITEDAPTNNMGDGKIADKDNVMKFDGRSKNFKSVMRRIKERKLKEQERLMKAKLLKWGIKEGVVNEGLSAGKGSISKGNAIDINFVGYPKDAKESAKKYKINIRITDDQSADVWGPKANILAYLRSPEYGMEPEEIKDLFGKDLLEAINEEKYEAFFRKAMKKFKIKDIDDLNDKERVKFFNWVDKNWDAGENETD
jgi:hypothetical protein